MAKSQNSVSTNSISLTEVEVRGLQSPFNFADGHAYQDLTSAYKEVISDLPALWEKAVCTSIPNMERWFRDRFADFYKIETLKSVKTFSICPTASNSIDIVGAWAKHKKIKIGLIEPTFDNLALLLKRRGVEIFPLTEETFRNPRLLDQAIVDHSLEGIFTVDPNNPTGMLMSEGAFCEIVGICKSHNVVLIVDRTFRMFAKTDFDDYAICIDQGVDFITIEDTGKSWPTLDMKASILAYSESVASDLRQIYEELYLCVSNLSLAVIGSFIDATTREGGAESVQRLTQQRRAIVAEALIGTNLEVLPTDPGCHMSICWIDCSALEMNDHQIVEYLSKFGVTVLPGCHFYWAGSLSYENNRIRISLLKPASTFYAGIAMLREALIQHLAEVG